LLITNQAGGVINANGAFPLQFNSGTVTNLGLAEATAGGTLQVYVTVVNKGGTLLATGSTSAVQFDAARTFRVALSAPRPAPTRLHEHNHPRRFHRTRRGHHHRTYTVSNGEETVLLGTINNTGLISVLSDNANTFLTFNAAVTLTGNGTITMSQAISNGPAYIAKHR